MSDVHIIDDDGDVEVWLDTEVAERDGICIGHGSTCEEAVNRAIDDLTLSLAELKRLRREVPA